MSDEEKNKYLDLERFNYNKDDLFGHYAEIEMEFYGPEGNKIHLFKIISSGIQTNFYNDVPFNHHTKPAYIHEKMTDIVRVVECGTVEEKIYRVPIKDIKILPTKQDKEIEKWQKIAEKLVDKILEMDVDGEVFDFFCKYIPMEKCDEFSDGYCEQCIIDWARKEVEKC